MYALIIDDSLAMRRVIGKIMTKIGFEVLEASHGQEGLKQLEAHQADIEVILVDWNMPEMNGIEFVQHVRGRYEFEDLRILMVTVETNTDRMAHALNCGADEFVMKPFTPQILVEKLKLVGITTIKRPKCERLRRERVADALQSHNLAPPSSLQRNLLSHAADLSMLPEVAREALELVRDPDCCGSHFSSVVGRDVKLATDILSFANSAVFACSEPIADLHQAITRLGFRQCRNLILTSSVASLMKRMPLEQEWIRELIWEHSFVTATTCAYLNRYFDLSFQGEEFIAGLLHDFGRLLIALSAPELFDQADPMDFIESASPIQVEHSILSTDHCRFGAWFAQYNGLPEELVAAIRFHHEPTVKHASQKLTILVAAADNIANYLQIHAEPEGYEARRNPHLTSLQQLAPQRHDKLHADIESELIHQVYNEIRETVRTTGAAT